MKQCSSSVLAIPKAYRDYYVRADLNNQWRKGRV